MLRLDLIQFLLGTQIDGAEPLALAADAVEFFLRLRRSAAVRRPDLISASSAAAAGSISNSLADFVFDIGEPALCGIAALFAARRFGARFADGFECGARGLVGFGQVGLGLRQPVGSGAARGRGGLDFADKRLARFGEFLRRVFEFAALGLRLGRCARP